MCGLNNWIKDDGIIDVSANLYYRDIDNDNIESALKVLAYKFPNLELILHSGADFEELDCTATFHIKNGIVTRCVPEIKKIRPCCFTFEDCEGNVTTVTREKFNKLAGDEL